MKLLQILLLGVLLAITPLCSFTPIEIDEVIDNRVDYGEFCDGWEAGYVNGWCYGKGPCLPPLVPLCPLPRLGEDNYNGGYNRGFLQGVNNRQRSSY